MDSGDNLCRTRRQAIETFSPSHVTDWPAYCKTVHEVGCQASYPRDIATPSEERQLSHAQSALETAALYVSSYSYAT
jgi:hypothetical protein